MGIGGMRVETGATSEKILGRKLLRVVIMDEIKLEGVRRWEVLGLRLVVELLEYLQKEVTVIGELSTVEEN